MVEGRKRASVETTGVSVTEAIAEGLALLEVELDEVDVEVLAEPARGLFGLGSREAHVRVSIRPPAAASAPRVRPAPEPEPAAPPAAPPAPAVRSAPQPAPSAPPAPAPTAVAPKPAGEAEPAPEPASTGLEETARAVVEELLALMGIEDARVTVVDGERADDEAEVPLLIDIRASGDLLIGPHGETLSALQHITRLIIGREKAGRRNIILDVNRYRSRREDKLRSMAQRLAQQAVDTDRTIVLEPMPPFERRIIHLALRDHKDVTTHSIGEGEHRKVTIIPKFD